MVVIDYFLKFVTKQPLQITKPEKMKHNVVLSLFFMFFLSLLSQSTAEVYGASLMVGASQAHNNISYDIVGEGVGKEGTYLVRVTISSRKGNVSAAQFKLSAVHGVIFKGFLMERIGQQKPLAAQQAETEHADFFKSFWRDGAYQDYADVVNPVAGRVKCKEGYRISAVVLVKKIFCENALRKQA